MTRKSTLLITLLAAISLPVLAQTATSTGSTATPRIDQRQANQQQRIDQGIRSGALTTQEAARLEKGQERIQRREDKAKADGAVTAKEREHLLQAENKQSQAIYREKHDRQVDRNHDGKNDRRRK